MINWLTRSKGSEESQHPLGTEDGIAEAIGSLNPARAESNLIEMADLIGDPDRISLHLPPEDALRALTRIDEAAQGFIAEVWSAFLTNNKLDHLGEQKLKALDKYYGAAFTANRHALRLLIQKPSIGGRVPTEAAARVSSRMMRAHVARARILHLRYRAPEAAWWDTGSNGIALIGQTAALNLKQRAYADDAVPTTPWVEHLLGLFLETSPLGNCNPRQMDLLFRVLRWLEPHYMVRDSYSPQAPYLTRLEPLQPPRRLAEAVAPDAGNIYFGPGMAYGHLVRLRATMKVADTLQDWMRGSQCTPEEAISVIDALIMHWSERPPQRMSERQRRDAAIRVINGFSQIRRMVAFAEFARSGRKVGYTSHLEMLKFDRRGFADAMNTDPDGDDNRWANATPIETIEILETAGDKQMMDDWQMQDVSGTGVGAIALFLKPWMVIGAFVGYRLTDEVDWRIGVLRRIHRKESGHPSLGIESFPETPLCAQVIVLRIPPGGSPQHELARLPTMPESEDAIVVSQEKCQVLVPGGTCAPGGFFVLSVGGHREVVRMTQLIHGNADCELIQYEMLLA